MNTRSMRNAAPWLALMWLVLGTALPAAAQTVLVGWGVEYPGEAGNTRKSQLKNVLLEGLLGDFFDRGWIAFDAPHPTALDGVGILKAYGEEARRNGAGAGVYFHIRWSGDQESWLLKELLYGVVDFSSQKVKGFGSLKIRDFVLPSKEEESLNQKALEELRRVIKTLL